jgi:hypothetical protein
MRPARWDGKIGKPESRPESEVRPGTEMRPGTEVRSGTEVDPPADDDVRSGPKIDGGYTTRDSQSPSQVGTESSKGTEREDRQWVHNERLTRARAR